ncbi:methyltransferase [Corynebacterium ulceribovis]|uniref:DUF7782 domain-containing protein n=1 Tax=Corynebacterium ulceribovis TaxID=487732 RepID=UPI0003790860|nr:methyltransferase [Corynebacterium ulceribovis]
MTSLTPISTEFATAISQQLRGLGLTEAGVRAALGAEGWAALLRREPAAADWHLHRQVAADATSQQVATALRAVILRQPVTEADLEAAFGPELVGLGADCGAIARTADGAVRITVNVQPMTVGAPADAQAGGQAGEQTGAQADASDYFLFSDQDAALAEFVPDADHVPGAGQASLTLADSVPTTPTASLLDVGCGSGVQMLLQAGQCAQLTGIDVSQRAVDYATATMQAAGLSHRSRVLAGSWFEPVAGEKFTRIVANPPFVVGPPKVEHVYRDSGLGLDEASRLVVSQAADYLTPGGTAHLLASWVHVAEQAWQQRVASWLPAEGVRAWVLQRDVADPALYVGTWLRDESIDPRSQVARERTQEWLDYLYAHDVDGIGFGFIVLQAISGPSEVVCEEFDQPYTDPLGTEVAEYLLRADWLAKQTSDSVGAARYQLRPTVARENVAVMDTDTGMGFAPQVVRLTRMDGPRWSHDVDELTAALVAGLRPDGLPLDEVAALLGYSQGLDDDGVAALANAARGVIVDLVRHGLVLPAEISEVQE